MSQCPLATDQSLICTVWFIPMDTAHTVFLSFHLYIYLDPHKINPYECTVVHAVLVQWLWSPVYLNKITVLLNCWWTLNAPTGNTLREPDNLIGLAACNFNSSCNYVGYYKESSHKSCETELHIHFLSLKNVVLVLRVCHKESNAGNLRGSVVQGWSEKKREEKKRNHHVNDLWHFYYHDYLVLRQRISINMRDRNNILIWKSFINLH